MVETVKAHYWGLGWAGGIQAEHDYRHIHLQGGEKIHRAIIEQILNNYLTNIEQLFNKY